MTPTEKQYAQTRTMLRELGIPVHRVGYQVLCEAIPRYAMDHRQAVTKVLYPDLAKVFGFANGYVAERTIRCAVSAAWECKDAELWEQYFPRREKVPTNTVFIATLADRLK